jgi:hypothetical protein
MKERLARVQVGRDKSNFSRDPWPFSEELERLVTLD